MAELTTPADTTATSCCVPEAQAKCCEPNAKAECCDPRHGEGCGCSASAPRAPRGDHEQLPDTAKLASLGCGNPTAVAALHEGETVLDLGSGGGSTFCSQPSASGRLAKVYGLDMTDECLSLPARTLSRTTSRMSSSTVLHRGDTAPDASMGRGDLPTAYQPIGSRLGRSCAPKATRLNNCSVAGSRRRFRVRLSSCAQLGSIRFAGRGIVYLSMSSAPIWAAMRTYPLCRAHRRSAARFISSSCT
jgi:hypothetical protein